MVASVCKLYYYDCSTVNLQEAVNTNMLSKFIINNKARDKHNELGIKNTKSSLPLLITQARLHSPKANGAVYTHTHTDCVQVMCR